MVTFVITDPKYGPDWGNVPADPDELRSYPPRVYEFLILMRELIEKAKKKAFDKPSGRQYSWEPVPIPKEWIDESQLAEAWELLAIDDRKGKRQADYLSPKGKAAAILGPKAEVPTSKSKPRKLNREAQALGLLATRPDLTTIEQIAAHIGCNPKQITGKRAPKLQEVLRSRKAKIDPSRPLRRGSKDQNGHLHVADDADDADDE